MVCNICQCYSLSNDDIIEFYLPFINYMVNVCNSVNSKKIAESISNKYGVNSKRISDGIRNQRIIAIQDAKIKYNKGNC